MAAASIALESRVGIGQSVSGRGYRGRKQEGGTTVTFRDVAQQTLPADELSLHSTNINRVDGLALCTYTMHAFTYSGTRPFRQSHEGEVAQLDTLPQHETAYADTPILEVEEMVCNRYRCCYRFRKCPPPLVLN